jgi:hypothetical protein
VVLGKVPFNNNNKNRIFFCIALHPHLRAAEKRLKEHADRLVSSEGANG